MNHGKGQGLRLREGAPDGLSPQLRAALDEIPVRKLAEYLCERLQLTEGRTMLQVKFVDGRYERMRPYRLAARAPETDLPNPANLETRGGARTR
jgi:hypothetical protein